MVNIADAGAGNYLPKFNDPYIHTCWIDGQTFDDAGVYQQHMLMYHGQNVDVYEAGKTVIQAPVAPVISQPLGTIAPGVTLIPALDRPFTFTPEYTPPLKAISPLPYTPAPVAWKGTSAPGTKVNGSVSGSGWNELLGIGAILALGIGLARSKRKAKR